MKIFKYKFYYLITAIFCCNIQVHAKDLTKIDDCILKSIKSAKDNITIKEIKLQCYKKVENKNNISDKNYRNLEYSRVLDERLANDRKNTLRPFTLMAHKPNYLILGAYNKHDYNVDNFREQYNDDTIKIKDLEAQFQLSIKTPLALNLFDKNIDIYGAYTARSFWQIYSQDVSSPFRETNHEPEIWLQFHPKWEFFGFRNTVNTIGMVHQSNGQGGVLSRSWNRIHSNLIFEKVILL
jgi:phospholipase A1